MAGPYVRHEPSLGLGRHAGKTKEHDSGVNSSHTKDELAEILVRRDQQRAMLIRSTQDRFVIDAWTQLGDVEHLMTIAPQTVDNWPVYALVCDNVHVPCSAIG